MSVDEELFFSNLIELVEVSPCFALHQSLLITDQHPNTHPKPATSSRKNLCTSNSHTLTLVTALHKEKRWSGMQLTSTSREEGPEKL